MNDIHDFKKYREALIILPHIDEILKVFNLTERALKLFGYYVPVARVLRVISDQKIILNKYKEEFEIIKNNKGKKV